MTNTDFNKSPVSFKPTAALRDPIELVAHGLASVADLPDLEKVAARYAVAVTPAIAALIDPNDPDDPIARLVVAAGRDFSRETIERADPIGDETNSVPSKASCIATRTGCCSSWCMFAPVYCRFCFRREMVGPGKPSAMPD